MFGTSLCNFEPVQPSKRRASPEARRPLPAAAFDRVPDPGQPSQPEGHLRLPPVTWPHTADVRPARVRAASRASRTPRASQAAGRNGVALGRGAADAARGAERATRARAARSALDACKLQLRRRIDAQRADAQPQELADLDALIRSYRLVEAAMEKEHQDWDPLEGARRKKTTRHVTLKISLVGAIHDLLAAARRPPAHEQHLAARLESVQIK